MNKEFFIKNKKVFLISFVVLFIGLMFLLKSSSVVKNNSAVTRAGLIYNNETLNDLVNRDTDGDGVMDWEEGLWGTDPKKPDTFGHGLGDAAEIAKMKVASGKTSNDNSQGGEKLTETDKFSRELFTSVTALSQAGALDQGTLNNLNATVLEQIGVPVVKTTFSSSDIKVVQDSSVQNIKKYDDALNAIFKKSPLFQESYDGITYEIGKRFMDVMKPFETDENADTSILSNLDPLIKEIGIVVNGIVKMPTPVPAELVTLHLNVINGLEKVIENLNNLKLVETDPIVAVGAANKFSDNMESLGKDINKLRTMIDNKLKN